MDTALKMSGRVVSTSGSPIGSAPLKNGIKDFFGLDGATTRLGLDYGITNWLMVGIGRSTLNKEVDGFFKAKVLRQTESGNIPVSLSVMGSTGIQTTAAPALPPGSEYYFSNRVAYTGQLLIARKFSNRFSMQLMPTLVHYNLVPLEADPNNVLSIGVGGRLKLSQRISLTGEYYYNIEQMEGSHNALACGIDIETGGHVFQLLFTNSTALPIAALSEKRPAPGITAIFILASTSLGCLRSSSQKA